ncbi:MAG: hypothetical protein HY706_19855 [Candidatus Hydrogenedentes bacterium]|nr:hypothetical protein [Candidatus Hydrogenedentota bacterium]
MIMADVFKILFLILGTLITIVCYWLLFEALFSGIVERARREYEGHALRISVLGLLVSLPLVAIGLGLMSGPAVGKLAGVVVLSTLILLGLMGSTGLARQIGSQLASADDAAHCWRRVLRGGAVLSITFVLPVIGWFFMLPLTLASGIGAILAARWNRRRDESAPAMQMTSA